ncbi:2Fe-2S iron-sulfur cluster binding domain-containing protein [bacterium]|nr:2Fe-2S iron-sulfur cluster binding domain-containing protein [bacterium]
MKTAEVKVRLFYKGRMFNVGTDSSVLDSLELNGVVQVPFSCRAGNCNFCLLKLISGTLNEEAFYNLEGSQVEKDMFKSCVAFPQSDLYCE